MNPDEHADEIPPIEFADGSPDRPHETDTTDDDPPFIPGDDPAPEAKPDAYHDWQIYPGS